MTIKERFGDAGNFTVYYGRDHLDELKRFDIAIIEPMAWDSSSIRELKQNKVIVLAYLSVVEVHPEQLGSVLPKESLLQVEGEFVKNHEYNTYYADLQSEKWRMHLYRKAQMYLTEYGCDGLFLDTIGNLEDFRIPVNTKYAFIETAVLLLEKIKRDFNNPILVQNNGLGLLLHYTKNCIDGICWENTSFRHGIAGKFNRVIVKKLKSLQSATNLKILLLTEESSQNRKIRKFSERNHFLYYNAPKDYIQI